VPLATGKLDAVAGAFQEGLELLTVVALDDQDTTIAGATGAKALLATFEKGIEVGSRTGEADDQRGRLAALAGLAAVEADDTIAGVGGQAR
jgi:hypothetical protein